MYCCMSNCTSRVSNQATCYSITYRVETIHKILCWYLQYHKRCRKYLFIVVFWCLAQLYGDKKDDKIVLELLDKVRVCSAIFAYMFLAYSQNVNLEKLCVLCDTPTCTLRCPHIYNCICLYVFIFLMYIIDYRCLNIIAHSHLCTVEMYILGLKQYAYL